jgi:endo-1,4-beta-xylanase
MEGTGRSVRADSEDDDENNDGNNSKIRYYQEAATTDEDGSNNFEDVNHDDDDEAIDLHRARSTGSTDDGNLLEKDGTHDDEEDSVDDDDDETDFTLKHYASAACKRVDVGTAIMPAPLFQPDAEDYGAVNEELHDAIQTLSSTPYSRFVLSEFNAVVVEHHMKWGPLCGEGTARGIQLGVYDFTTVDKMVDWALSNRVRVKGHVLVWSVTSPPVLRDMSPEQVSEHTRRHIFTVMNHFRGRIQTWDVVNEPLSPDGTLARNLFYDKLGPDYVATCLRWAHEADPTARLILNENKVEGTGSAKSERFYEMCSDLVRRKVPIHGVGLQAHLNAAGVGRNRPPTPRQLKAQIRRLGDLGLSVNLSELDVRVSQLPSELRTDAQTALYHDLVAAALSEPACDGIWLWGFTDRHTWVTHFYYDDEPTITDEEYRRKPAYYALREAIKSLTVGGVVGGGSRLDPVLLDSDVDASGNPWGHAWMPPEPDADGTAGSVAATATASDHHGRHNSSIFRGLRAGDARPDWLLDGKELDSGEEEVASKPAPAPSSVHGIIHEMDDDDDDDDDDDNNNNFSDAVDDANFDATFDNNDDPRPDAETPQEGTTSVDLLS